MSNTVENVAVYIGRFQPMHNGHLNIIKDALNDKEANIKHLIILIGSSNKARDIKNPFTFEERKDLIENILDAYQFNKPNPVKVTILPIHDYIYSNQKWISEVQLAIKKATHGLVPNKNIYLLGRIKDKSSAYMHYFPQYERLITKADNVISANDVNYTIDNKRAAEDFYNATDIRKVFFQANTTEADISAIEEIPLQTKEFLLAFMIKNKDVYNALKEEFDYTDKYRKVMIESLPYPNMPSLTADSVVTCAGHILLVKRKWYPGKGLYALPGGFFDSNEDATFKEAAIRELYEETMLDVSIESLTASYVKSDTFMDPNRSLRWRIITVASLFQLPYTYLPRVSGADDAETAVWVPLSDIATIRNQLFEDHFDVIDCLVPMASLTL